MKIILIVSLLALSFALRHGHKTHCAECDSPSTHDPAEVVCWATCSDGNEDGEYTCFDEAGLNPDVNSESPDCVADDWGWSTYCPTPCRVDQGSCWNTVDWSWNEDTQDWDYVEHPQCYYEGMEVPADCADGATEYNYESEDGSWGYDSWYCTNDAGDIDCYWGTNWYDDEYYGWTEYPYQSCYYSVADASDCYDWMYGQMKCKTPYSGTSFAMTKAQANAKALAKNTHQSELQAEVLTLAKNGHMMKVKAMAKGKSKSKTHSKSLAKGRTKSHPR